jgi:hypothetical protein
VIILTPAQERILRATRGSHPLHVNGRNMRAVKALNRFGLVTVEGGRVPGRTAKGRLDIVVSITPAGEQHFLRSRVEVRHAQPTGLRNIR